jgi:shikimate kinase
MYGWSQQSVCFHMHHILIIGPGGAGKTTCGSLLAQKLTLPFIDLDREFSSRLGNIDVHLEAFGYKSYFKKNSQLFRDVLSDLEHRTVIALSSGFMTYPDKETLTQNKDLVRTGGTSICLMPSADFAECVSIIVSRQMGRGMSLNEENQEAAIEKRFWIYRELGDHHIYSSESPEIVAELMVSALESAPLRTNHRLSAIP